MPRPRKNGTTVQAVAEDLLDHPDELVLEGKEASAYQEYLACARRLQNAETAMREAQAAFQQSLIALNNVAVPTPKVG
jgi:hypothetical protein